MRKTRSQSTLALVLLLLGLFVIQPSALAQSGDATASSILTVTFVDVGEGDGIWLKTPDGWDILIDAGRYNALPDFLAAQGVTDVEVLIATHPDADHIGGFVPILETLPVEAALVNGQQSSSQTDQRFRVLLAEHSVPTTIARAGQTYTWGCCVTAAVLHPTDVLDPTETNDNSIVLKVSHRSVDFMFTGDVAELAETEILGRGYDLAAEVLKVAHHGSRYSSTAPFLAAVSARDAIVSVGPNGYGHPAPEVLQRLADVGAHIWRTDQEGNVIVRSYGYTYTVQSPIIPVPPVIIYLPLIQGL